MSDTSSDAAVQRRDIDALGVLEVLAKVGR
jgi:hypothetical protein